MEMKMTVRAENNAGQHSARIGQSPTDVVLPYRIPDAGGGASISSTPKPSGFKPVKLPWRIKVEAPIASAKTNQYVIADLEWAESTEDALDIERAREAEARAQKNGEKAIPWDSVRDQLDIQARVPYAVSILPEAARALKLIPKGERTNLRNRIDALAHDPRPTWSKTLHGSLEGYRRIRAGDYRAIYRIDDTSVTVLVTEIGHRSSIYQIVENTRSLALRRALLTTALAAALLDTLGRPEPPEVTIVRRWLDSWMGIGLIVTGMARQGYRLHLTNVEPGTWRTTFTGGPMLGAEGFGTGPTPWRAVQVAAWEVVRR